ncbi:unnamed protein product [Haemonchus placei]|uniref:Apple domain-containing protein n=1 Tax=Haemonchus placei TaxID=6290 RepID=A0A0N4WNX6_HAEPC|nr:unnamed protein product [Haemonchus placei]
MYIYKTVYSQTYGGCLKKCVEEFPECAIVGIQAEGSDYLCYIYALNSALNYNPSPGGYSMEIYVLERNKVDVECPLAAHVFP